jgi:hypothetical protein
MQHSLHFMTAFSQGPPIKSFPTLLITATGLMLEGKLIGTNKYFGIR